jgi:hypothetical protein
MKSLMKRAGFAVLVLTGFATAGSAETFYVGCNTKGLAKMSPEQANRVFWNRLANNGGGNGGESVDVLVDLATSDVTITCVATADENTGGTVSVQLPDGTIIPVGPLFPEVDPNEQP